MQVKKVFYSIENSRVLAANPAVSTSAAVHIILCGAIIPSINFHRFTARASKPSTNLHGRRSIAGKSSRQPVRNIEHGFNQLEPVRRLGSMLLRYFPATRSRLAAGPSGLVTKNSLAVSGWAR